MPKLNLPDEVEMLRREFGIDLLREKFVKRTDDEMFMRVGRMAMGGDVTRNKTALIWLGYLILTKSPYLPEFLRVV